MNISGKYMSLKNLKVNTDLSPKDLLRKGHQLGVSTHEIAEESAYPEGVFDLHNVNNCLIDAIWDAANAVGMGLQPLDVGALREDLQKLHLGNIGEMLFADQAVVELILDHLGLAGTPVILYDARGQAQEVAGGNNEVVIQIFHTGALHYVGRAANDAQKLAVSENSKVEV